MLAHQLRFERLPDRHAAELLDHDQRAEWDGKGETVAVPIPSNYTCTYTSTGGCWFRLKVSFASGNGEDTTTWTAYVSGDPVRLIE